VNGPLTVQLVCLCHPWISGFSYPMQPAVIEKPLNVTAQSTDRLLSEDGCKPFYVAGEGEGEGEGEGA